MRRRLKCCILLRIHFSTANQKIQIYFRYQSYTRRNLKKPWSSGDENAFCIEGSLDAKYDLVVVVADDKMSIFSLATIFHKRDEMLSLFNAFNLVHIPSVVWPHCLFWTGEKKIV